MTTIASSPVPADLKQMTDLVAPLPTEPVVAETIHPIQEALNEQAPEQKVDTFHEAPKTSSKISFEGEDFFVRSGISATSNHPQTTLTFQNWHLNGVTATMIKTGSAWRQSWRLS